MSGFVELVEELKKHLDCSVQHWLLGAGVSIESNVPPMYPLTERVKIIINSEDNQKNKELLLAIIADLDIKAHAEQYLSHLGDLIAVAERSKEQAATLGNEKYKVSELRNLYSAIVRAIGVTVRYGYKKTGDVEVIGKEAEPIVEVRHHSAFVKALIRNKANLLDRAKIKLFTTNYDTLLEDALAIEGQAVVDGFSGGAVGFWNPLSEYSSADSRQCFPLFKLHGSVDWQKNTTSGLIRVRYGTKYFSDLSEIMIYPQATKYIETQKDPFAHLFSCFRNALCSVSDNVLITCGYSFADAHINNEIEYGLRQRGGKATLIAFTNARSEGDVVVNPVLDGWLTDTQIGKRVFVATDKGLYYNSTTLPADTPTNALKWWTFSGLTSFLNTGEVE